MKKNLLLITLLLMTRMLYCQNRPVAGNDTIATIPGYNANINVLMNDHDPDGDSIYLAMTPGGAVIGDSIISYSFSLQEYCGIAETQTFKYFVSDTTPWMFSYDTGYVHVIIENHSFDSLYLNNINARFNAYGNHFYDFSSHNHFFVPKDSDMQTIFNSALWIGGLNEEDSLHLAGERFRQIGLDYYAGPISNEYDSAYDAFWMNTWKISKDEIEYHKLHYTEPDYNPPADLLNWPGNGDVASGQAAILSPFHDENANGIYEPLEGDYPLIRGDETIFFIFNDDRPHSETSGNPLGVEVHGMAYAFDMPDDSAFNNSVFLHYDIYNRSGNTFYETYLGVYTDLDLGYPWDDFIGCDVSRGCYFTYNGSNDDEVYGQPPPAQGVAFLGGVLKDADGYDNPSYRGNGYHGPSFFGDCSITELDSTIQMMHYGENDSAQFLVDAAAINGAFYGNGTTDDERLGMTRFIYYSNAGNALGDPEVAEEYYGYMKGFWKDGTHFSYGGYGHPDHGAVGPDCDFVYPENSDTCNWGTNGELPNGGFNQNGFYWMDDRVGNEAGDRRGVGITGPFTFEPGDMVELDLAYVFAWDHGGSRRSSVDTMKMYIDQLRKWFAGKDSTGASIGDLAEKGKISIWPNPASDYVFVKGLKTNRKCEYRIYNLYGETVRSGEINNSSPAMISLSSLKPGYYLLRIEVDGAGYTRKLLVK